MHHWAQHSLFFSLVVALLLRESCSHGLRPSLGRTLLQESSSVASGETGNAAAVASSTSNSASASSSASSTGGTSSASARAGPGRPSTSASVSAPANADKDKGSLNATFITIYDNIVKRVEDGEDLDVAAKDEVKASRFKISSIWAEVLREVGQGDKGLECQDEEALAKSQAQDFAQALTDALILANSDLSEEVLMEAKETVAAGMEEDFEEAVAAACGISGFSIGPKFKFALRLVEPVTEGYVVALGGGKSDGVRSTPRRIPSDEVSSTSTSTTGSGSASASTSTSGSGSASASSSASASGSGSTSASTSMSSSTDSASRMTPTVNGADGRCRRQFIVCCLKRKILSGECDCIAGRCDAVYMDGMWHDKPSGTTCSC